MFVHSMGINVFILDIYFTLLTVASMLYSCKCKLFTDINPVPDLHLLAAIHKTYQKPFVLKLLPLG